MAELFIVPSAGDTLALGSAEKPMAGLATNGAVANVHPAAGGLSGHRAVVVNASGQLVHADNTNPAHAAAVAGISLDGGSLGDPIRVASGGELEELSWSWTPGAEIFLNGTGGQLSHTAPTSGFVLSVGSAVTATRMRVQLSKAIVLA